MRHLTGRSYQPRHKWLTRQLKAITPNTNKILNYLLIKVYGNTNIKPDEDPPRPQLDQRRPLLEEGVVLLYVGPGHVMVRGGEGWEPDQVDAYQPPGPDDEENGSRPSRQVIISTSGTQAYQI